MVERLSSITDKDRYGRERIWICPHCEQKNTVFTDFCSSCGQLRNNPYPAITEFGILPLR